MLKKILILGLLILGNSLILFAQDIPAREFHSKGIEEAKKGNFEAAIEAYSNAIKADSGFANAYSGRGLAYLRNRQVDLAINDFSTAIALNPNSVGFYINRSSAFSVKKEFDKSLADLERAVEINPIFPDAYSARGNIYRQMKEFQLSLDNYSKAIEINPYSYFYYGRCMTNYDFGKFEEAVADCSEALSRNPKDSWAFYYRGLSRVKLEHNSLATSDFQRALEINPNFISAKQQLNQILKIK